MQRAASDQLADYRSIWERKPVLRLVYDDFYDRVSAACRAGLTIEIGGGIGNLKRRLTEVVATDIQCAPWLDCVADAQRLPFGDSCAANIVMVVQWFALAAYPLSGGFQPWSLIGEGGVRRLLRIERALEPMLGRLTGFRMLLVVEKAMGSER
jgi:hypothetical protein